ncbi:carbonic anhydrase [Achromobacter spanius]|uniref:carbonic anhydrase n=1 Tax=Achromobacter spanius TaxID=217203 RepID=UPI001F5412E1|nr:carbonic anhydrase [Achromobacter spanius]
MEYSNPDPEPKDVHAGKVKRPSPKTIVKSTPVTASKHCYRPTISAHEFSGHRVLQETLMCDCAACVTPSPDSTPRRRLLLGAAGLAAFGATGWAETANAEVPSNDIGGDAALKRLLAGNTRYAANKPNMRDFSAGRAARVKTQKPIAAILSCSDSRVAPELAFDQSPGDVFIVRVAGNFVNEDGLASFEYAAKILNVPLILVLGHNNCGAVDATIKVLKENAELPGHLPELVNAIKPAVERAVKGEPKNLLTAAIAENVRQAVQRLQTAQPVLQGMVQEKKLMVAGGVYDLATGKVTLV